MFEVYKATCKENGKVYIGITSRGIEQRWKEHVSDAFNTKHPDYDTIFKKAIRKYGENGFTIEKIDEANSFEELKELERTYIAQYRSFAFDKDANGYNSTRGGDGMLGYGLKPVVQIQVYPLQIIQVYDGVTYAEKIHGRGILEVCNKITHYVDGYTWMYKDEVDGLSDKEFLDRVYSHLNVLVQIDLNGNIVRYWKGSREASETCGYNQGNISYCCAGKRKFSDGFQWMFYNDYTKCKNDLLVTNQNLIKQVCQYDIDGNLVRKFKTLRDASSQTGIAKSRLSEACNRCYSILNGYIWRYGDHVFAQGEIKHVQQEVESGLRIGNVQTNKHSNESSKYERMAVSSSRSFTKDRGFIQYSLSGIEINQFQTLGDASFYTSTNFKKIIDVCTKKRNKANNYIWRFADEPLTEEERLSILSNTTAKEKTKANKEAERSKISKRNGLKYSKQCFKNIETDIVYFSQKEVCDIFHCSPTTLQKACHNSDFTCAGYHWRYADKSEALDREAEMLSNEEDETDDWYKHYFELVDYINGFHAFPTKQTGNNSELNLYEWMNNVRTNYHSKAKCLSAAKIKKLKEINFPFTPQDDKWNHMYAVYQDYIACTGDDYVSKRTVYKDEKLGQWAMMQRRLCDKGSLKPERKAHLLQIAPNFFSKRDNHGRIISSE